MNKLLFITSKQKFTYSPFKRQQKVQYKQFQNIKVNSLASKNLLTSVLTSGKEETNIISPNKLNFLVRRGRLGIYTLY